MKYFAVLLVVILVAGAWALTDEQKARIKNNTNACVSETHVDVEVAKKTRTSGVFEDDPKLKEFLFCFNKKGGFQNDAGDFQLDVWRAKFGTVLTPEEVENVITKCAVTKGTPQESAFESSKCVYNNTPRNIYQS